VLITSSCISVFLVSSLREVKGGRSFVIASLENVPTRRKIDATEGRGSPVLTVTLCVCAFKARVYAGDVSSPSPSPSPLVAEEEIGGKGRVCKQQESFRWPFKARTFRSVTVFRVHRRATPQGGHLRAGEVVSTLAAALSYKRPPFLMISRVKQN